MDEFIYEDTKIKLYNEDCLKIFPLIDNESIDLIITSPPYCMGKEYENTSDDINSFLSLNKKVIYEAQRVLKKGGNLCWQIGFHVKDSVIVPLDCLIYQIVEEINKTLSDDCKLYLHNRIVWSFGHGLNAEKRLSGRYETIMWYTKGKEYLFNLNAIRVPQKYPGKKYSKGKKAGQYSGNPLGKNPSDVWDIPNVKANDTVIIIGKQGTQSISFDELAESIGTIGYELVCNIGRRVPRIYTKENLTVNITDYLINNI